MNKGRSRQYLIIPTLIALFGAWGCAKKAPPAGPSKAAPASGAATQEKQPPVAEAAKREQGEHVFNAKTAMAGVDKNGDGKVTREEYYAIWKDKAVADRNFKMIDRNGDGVLTADEFTPSFGTK